MPPNATTGFAALWYAEFHTPTLHRKRAKKHGYNALISSLQKLKRSLDDVKDKCEDGDNTRDDAVAHEGDEIDQRREGRAHQVHNAQADLGNQVNKRGARRSNHRDDGAHGRRSERLFGSGSTRRLCCNQRRCTHTEHEPKTLRRSGTSHTHTHTHVYLQSTYLPRQP